METSRSAPSGGYDFGNKRDYRRRVYSILGCVANKSQAQLLILPSTEGAEIPLAIQKGYQPHNIHAVDRNAKLLENAPWRKQYPDINVYPVELEAACEQISKKGLKLHAANLDLCSFAGSRSLKTILYNTLATRVLADQATVALTFLRGRENEFAQNELAEQSSSKKWTLTDETVFIKDPACTNKYRPGISSILLRTWNGPRTCTEQDAARVAWGGHLFTHECGLPDNEEYYAVVSFLIKAGAYKSSNNQTMIWLVINRNNIKSNICGNCEFSHVTDKFCHNLFHLKKQFEAQYKNNKYVASMNVANNGDALFQTLVKTLITRTELPEHHNK